MLARLEALENDNAGLETVQVDDDDEASLDDDDQGYFAIIFYGINIKTSADHKQNHLCDTCYFMELDQVALEKGKKISLRLAFSISSLLAFFSWHDNSIKPFIFHNILLQS